MDAKQNGQQAAFARPVSAIDPANLRDYATAEFGMTKREAFAMHAPPMPEAFEREINDPYNVPGYPHTQGKICEECKAGNDCDETEDCKKWHALRDAQKRFRAQYMATKAAHWAVTYADALLAELAKEA